jgi:hypothetical protein
VHADDRLRLEVAGLLLVGEVRRRLEVVGVELAVDERGVRQDVVRELLDLELQPGLLGEVVLDEVEDLGVRDGGGADDEGLGGVGRGAAGGGLVVAAGGHTDGKGDGGQG